MKSRCRQTKRTRGPRGHKLGFTVYAPRPRSLNPLSQFLRETETAERAFPGWEMKGEGRGTRGGFQFL